MPEDHKGGCVCGNVRYRTEGEPARVTVCHCTWCQRRTGSAFAVALVFRQEQVVLLGDKPRLYRHRSDESGRWPDLHFCPACGGNVGFTLEWVPEVMAIDAGTFDSPDWIDPVRFDFRYIYMRSAQCWSEVPDHAETFEKHFRS